MIYTVTLNPSIDFIVRIDKVEIGEVNRMESDDKFAGGKGINVSRILQRLGVDNTAIYDVLGRGGAVLLQESGQISVLEPTHQRFVRGPICSLRDIYP